MTLLIGSTYANGNPSDIDWIKIQKHFIESTTKDYDFIGVAPRPEYNAAIHDHIKIIPCTETDPVVDVNGVVDGLLNEHMTGLKTIKKYFENNQPKYDRLLILDSDAFPIRQGWQELLEGSMRRLLHRCEIACAVRCEMLETMLHVCTVYAKQSSIPYLRFEPGVQMIKGVPRKCILSAMKEITIYLAEYETDRRNLAFPLIKSNKHMDTLLSGSIYYDLFYHHGSGSRKPLTRARAYWKHIDNSRRYHRQQNLTLKQELIDNPDETIARLAGWNDGEYGGQ